MDADEHDAQGGGAIGGDGGTIGDVDGSAVSDAVADDNGDADVADTASDDGNGGNGGADGDGRNEDGDGNGGLPRRLPRRVVDDQRALAYYADAARVVLPLVQSRLANAGAWVDMAADRLWESRDEAVATLYQVLYGVDSTSVVVPALFWSDVPAYFRAAQNIARAEVMLGLGRGDQAQGAAELVGDALRERTAAVIHRTAAWRSYLSETRAVGADSARLMFVGHVPLDVEIDDSGAALVSPRGAVDRMSAPDAQLVPFPLRADAVFAWPALSAFAIFVPMSHTLDRPWVFQAIRLADDNLRVPLYVAPPEYSDSKDEGSAEGVLRGQLGDVN